jgi:hypothetical protein
MKIIFFYTIFYIVCKITTKYIDVVRVIEL